MSNEPTKRNLQIGWHALVDNSKMKAIVIGRVSHPGPYVFSSLDLVSKDTEQELMESIASYEKMVPMKKSESK